MFYSFHRTVLQCFPSSSIASNFINQYHQKGKKIKRENSLDNLVTAEACCLQIVLPCCSCPVRRVLTAISRKLIRFYRRKKGRKKSQCHWRADLVYEIASLCYARPKCVACMATIVSKIQPNINTFTKLQLQQDYCTTICSHTS